MPTFMSAAETPLHYSAHGAGPVLVCQPGGPGRPASYLDRLGGVGRTLLLLDPRGVGGSAAAPSYSYTALADDLEALREHLGVDRMDLLGHSAGTFPVLTYAGAHPDRVGHVVLLTPPSVLVAPYDPPFMADLAARHFGDHPWFPHAVEAFLAFDPPNQTEAEMDDVLRRSAPLMYGEWTDTARQHATRPHDSTYAPPARDGFWAGAFDPAPLAKVTAPVTIIAGERDIFTGPTASDVIAGWFPDATVTWLAGCGHNPWIDQPGVTARAIEHALDR
jgi:proline iminopeptidase